MLRDGGNPAVSIPARMSFRAEIRLGKLAEGGEATRFSALCFSYDSYPVLASYDCFSEGRGFAPAGGVRSLNRRGRGPLVSADSFGFLFVATGDESLSLRSLNRRGRGPLVSADSFGFLFVATGDESLTPQRAFRSLSLRFRLPPSADSPLARRRPLETFAASSGCS